jgi:hypothetical protein
MVPISIFLVCMGLNQESNDQDNTFNNIVYHYITFSGMTIMSPSILCFRLVLVALRISWSILGREDGVGLSAIVLLIFVGLGWNLIPNLESFSII